MLINIIYFISICSVSILLAAIKHIKFETTLPLSSACIIGIMYLFALLGKLHAGYYFVLCFAVFAFALGCILFMRDKSIVKNLILSPGTILFFASFTVMNICCNGMKVFSGDELVHWGAIVKSMIFTHDLGTRNATTLTASNYPPGVSLLQYYCEEIFQMFRGQYAFSDWRLFLVHNTLIACFIIPVSCKIGKKILKSSFIYMLFSCLGILLYRNFFYSLQIDGLIGVASACGICMIFLSDSNDIEADIYSFSVAFILVLTKVSGILFSIVILLGMQRNRFYKQRQEGRLVSPNKKTIFMQGIEIVTIIGIWLSWKIETSLSNKMPANEKPADLRYLLRIMFGKDNTYRTETWNNFLISVFHKGIEFSNINTKLSYFFILVCCITIIIVISKSLRRTENSKAQSGTLCLCLSLIQMLIFYMGMLFTYLFQFGEDQSVSLSSFERYFNTALMPILFLTVTSILYLIKSSGKEAISDWSMLVIGFLISEAPFNGIITFLSRDDAKYTIEYVEGFQDLIDLEKSVHVDGEINNIYYIYQDVYISGAGQTALELYYYALPDESTYAKEPFYLSKTVNDWYVGDFDVDEWMRRLKESYDYVVIAKTDEYFLNNFASAFEDPKKIYDKTIYQVNKEDGRLSFLKSCSDMMK